jgi:L-threonylcarbamoyladenylate synthase
MRTEIYQVDPVAPQSHSIDRAARILREGGLVAFPTETVYGLGANALDARSVAGIFAAKGRPSYNPVIVHVANVERAKQLVRDWPASAQRLAERFWPGPLTLVLPRGDAVPDVVTAGGTSVGLRIPGHPVALSLLKAADLPVAAPSANRSAHISATTAEHVLRGLDGRIDLLLDAGPTPGGIESTILDLRCMPPRLLRPGLVEPAMVEEIVGPIERSPLVESGSNRTLPSPGMLSRHYAPTAILECVDEPAWPHVQWLLEKGLRVGWLTFHNVELAREGLVVLQVSQEPSICAAQLYAALHEFDALGVAHIVAEWPPEGEPWLAVRDRLRRAATRVVTGSGSA